MKEYSYASEEALSLEIDTFLKKISLPILETAFEK
jgi:hypothetical protein